MRDPLLRTGLALVVDGATLAQLKEVLDARRAVAEAQEEAPARVFEAAAGYAPTLGILGAVLGLIQVMEHLSRPRSARASPSLSLRRIYGVGAANLLFLPLAARLRARGVAADRRRELIAEGLNALSQRLHPRLVAQRLRGFATDMPRADEIAARISAGAARKSQVSA